MDFGDSKLFTRWRDPRSGVVSYILAKRAAPWQQAFYFTNPNMTRDGRYLYFYAGFPPSPGYVLGQADLLEGTVQAFQETKFHAASPLIDEETGAVWFTQGASVYRRGAGASDPVELVGRVETKALFGGRPIWLMGSHLLPSADGEYLNVDIEAGDTWHAGAMEIATGRYEVWQSFDVRYNHAQFSPTDPDLQMIAQDWWIDQNTGVHRPFKNRIWLVRRGEEAKPIYPESEKTGRMAHEWWARDGRGIWYVDYELGTEYYDLGSGSTTNVWPDGTCHSHASADDMLLCGDINTYRNRPELPVRVAFFNRHTGKQVDILSDWPLPPAQVFQRNGLHIGEYHIHPHPQFVLGDQWIAYTTTVLGQPDVALVRVADLVQLTK